MWEINNNVQLVSFLVSLLLGIIFCIIYDILRAFRLSVKHNSFSVFAEDILFFTVSSLITFILMLLYSNGEIRGYLLVGICIGFFAYYFTVSKYLLRITVRIFLFLKRIIHSIYSVIKRIVKIVLRFLSKNLRKTAIFLKKFLKSSKNHLKRKCKIVYTENDNLISAEKGEGDAERFRKKA